MNKTHNLDLALLRAFVEVADTGSMSVASVNLHLTQGAVSQRIKRLEAFLDCQLLLRDTQGSRLTAKGKSLLPDARRLLRMHDAFCASIGGRESAASVRLGLPFDMAGAPLAHLLKAFSNAFPRVEVKIFSASSTDLDQAFTNGKLDLVISQGPTNVELGERLAVDQLVWLGNEVTAAQRPLALCFLTANCAFRDTVFQRLDEEGIVGKMVFENASADTTLTMVRNGLAVTPWLQRLAPEDIILPLPDCGLPTLPEFAVRLQSLDDATRPVSDLADLIRDHFKRSDISLSEEMVGIS
ncbi:LysR family transcriptional regulator [Pseudomonas sp.]|uniref:LysR family transcriptional regulator n=1 Tax=Pseudomonas sp. TaxID=306 RepID=UPI0029AC9814|nr:LysR family transcriptional regulator [Pseudomonas sp.]MDX3743931.1 LysR family transcriptional regulator [Pseudomonas sp.]